MDISKIVLLPSQVEHGYRVEEEPRNNQVFLLFHGEVIKSWCSLEEEVKDKYIRGIAFQHEATRGNYQADCNQAIESGGLPT